MPTPTPVMPTPAATKPLTPPRDGPTQPSGTMSWEPVRQRLLGPDIKVALQAAMELREGIEIVHTVEFPLLLSALLPAFTSILTTKTTPNPDCSSPDHKLRNVVLEIICRMPSNEILRPHAPHLVAVALDILNRDFEENALLASRIIFDLYKVYRTLPQDYVQPYLDFVLNSYRTLPTSVQRNFLFPALATVSPSEVQPKSDTSMDIDAILAGEESSKSDKTAATEGSDEAGSSETTTPQKSISMAVTTPSPTIPRMSTSPVARLSPKSNTSFRVLTECPLIVMLMFQLYPKFLRSNIPALINVMMESLALRAPPIQSIKQGNQMLDANGKRLYFSRCRELVAAQAKTLSFLTYLLRGFSNDLKPYEDRLASNVVALMSTCPREFISTRKELLVATRHLLNSEFRNGFFRHVDALLDERVLMGSHHRYSEQTILRPLGYTTLSDLVHHVRSFLSMAQMSRVVSIFARVLHDSSMTLPMSTQYTAVRTLLSILDIVFNNKERDPQIGRDILVRILRTLVDKLEALKTNLTAKNAGNVGGKNEGEIVGAASSSDASSLHLNPSADSTESQRDLKSMIRAIIVGHKTLIWYINNYRIQREKEKLETVPQRFGANEEVATARLKITHTEHALIDKFIVLAFPCMKFLKEDSPENENRATKIPSTPDQYRDALTYFAAAFSTLDAYDLRRTLGRRLDLLVDAITEDSMPIIVPRHLLGANAKTSYEFCTMLLYFLVERLDELIVTRPKDVYFVPPPTSCNVNERERLEKLSTEMDKVMAREVEQTEKRSKAYLQLFERVLKSLSTFPDNERALRPHLKKLVSTSLRASMEKSDFKIDNHCMLLRYIFRSISAGKFEESYKEILPLIPRVLNGLFRILRSTQDEVLRNVIIELLLTIPARLSSLLPHMNLLLRVITHALESMSGDLVNLGLRTLEFWVDNLNPEFLFPELSKRNHQYACLMKALSLHLRPAPYPYGLLTLRLLGKLGGKNRRVLREPIDISDADAVKRNVAVLGFDFVWSLPNKADEPTEMEVDGGAELSHKMFSLDIPITRCLEILKRIALCSSDEKIHAKRANKTKEIISWSNSDELWEADILKTDLLAYCGGVVKETRQNQVEAAVTILRAALTKMLVVQDFDIKNIDLKHEEKDVKEAQNRPVGKSFDMQSSSLTLTAYENDLQMVGLGLMFGCTIADIGQNTMSFTKGLLTNCFVIVSTYQMYFTRIDANGSALHRHPPSSADGEAQKDAPSDEFEGGLGFLKPFGYFEQTGPLRHVTNPMVLNRSLVDLLSQPNPRCIEIGQELLRHVLSLPSQLQTQDRDGGKDSKEGETSDLGRGSVIYFEHLMRALIEKCVSSNWDRRDGLYSSICMIIEHLGASWAKKYESEIMYVALFSVKSAPKEMSVAEVKAFHFMIRVTAGLYGTPACFKTEKGFVFDTLSNPEIQDSQNKQETSESNESIRKPCDEVVQSVIMEVASTKQIVRLAARYILKHYIVGSSPQSASVELLRKCLPSIKRVLFSRSLRLLPLLEQIGVVEALTVIVQQVPDLFPLDDNHLKAFLSEVLKMSSVADGEMTDASLLGDVIDKNGVAVSAQARQSGGRDSDVYTSTFPSSALFLRRECIMKVNGAKVIIPDESPPGVQLRVSIIALLRFVIRGHANPFFDSDSSTQIGNIRPHVISLLFRSLVSRPLKAVSFAHDALKDVLSLSVVATDGADGSKSKSRLRKELLQTCIRPVLLNLRDYTRLSLHLLRGLSRLLSLLSSWFNKTLGEKLLDHLQKWTDPNRMRAQMIWREGEEPDVAAAIIDLFVLLPDAARCVEPLVKTTIKLEACLPAFKSRHIFSPYRKPLARYLNKHCSYTVPFFFQRLKTPLYSELFQDLIKLEESKPLRDYLSGKQFSVSLLSVCFERPLAIIRSEKNVSGTSPQKASMMNTAELLFVHGIEPSFVPPTQREVVLRQDVEVKNKKLIILQQEFNRAQEFLQSKVAANSSGDTFAKAALDDAKRRHQIAKVAYERGIKEFKDSKQRCAAELEKIKQARLKSEKDVKKVISRPMNIEALELQYQGFRLVETLIANDENYFKDHNDVIRAFRWLWRSKGRYLRLQHEQSVPPRYHGESKLLASFLVHYSRGFRNDVDLLFELIRIFLQSSASDFSFVRSFLVDFVSHGISAKQRKQVMQRFFILLAGESTEEIKTLTVQLVVFPMLESTFSKKERESLSSKTDGKFSEDGNQKTNAMEIDAAKSTDENTKQVEVMETDAVKAQGEDSKQADGVAADSGKAKEDDPKKADVVEAEEAVLIEEEDVKKFVHEVLFSNGKIISCGDRLKIELLRLANLFLTRVPNHVEKYGQDLIKYCWGLLKSDDTTTKSWAYLVVCRYASVLDTPSKVVLQVYVALLRSHQQEGKELVREALDLLVPALPRRLNREGVKKVVDYTSRIMFEEGNSVPQLAHIWHTVVNHPDVFYEYRSQFVRYMINSLNRLGLPPNCPVENRALAIRIVGLVIGWDKKQCSEDVVARVDTGVPKGKKRSAGKAAIGGESEEKKRKTSFGPVAVSSTAKVKDGRLLDPVMVDTLVNFLVRLKILLADPKVESIFSRADSDHNKLFKSIASEWKQCGIRPVYLEKVVAMCKEANTNRALLGKDEDRAKGKSGSKSKSKSGQANGAKGDNGKKINSKLLSACLDIFIVLAEVAPSNPFLCANPFQLNEILISAFIRARQPEESEIREKLQKFIVEYICSKKMKSKSVATITKAIRVQLEQFLVDAESGYRKFLEGNHGSMDLNRHSGSRYRQNSVDSERSEVILSSFALGVIQEVNERFPSFHKPFCGSLLALLQILVKKHTADASARQKQGTAPYAPQGDSMSITHMHHTPTGGILNESFITETTGATSSGPKSSQNKEPYPSSELNEFDPTMMSAVLTTQLLGSSDIPYTFTENRRMLFKTLGNILDSSNNLQLLLVAVRVVGKWLLQSGGPLTAEERHRFLQRITTFDYNGLSDVVAQPLADIVSYFVIEILNQRGLKVRRDSEKTQCSSIDSLVAGVLERENEREDVTMGRSLVSCLLSAKRATRQKMLALFICQTNAGENNGNVSSFGIPLRTPTDLLWQLLHSDFEGLGGRYWIVVLVELFLGNLCCKTQNKETQSTIVVKRELPLPRLGPTETIARLSERARSDHQLFISEILQRASDIEGGGHQLIAALQQLVHCDVYTSESVFMSLFAACWNAIPNDNVRVQLADAMESLLARPFHSQFFKRTRLDISHRSVNSIRSFLKAVHVISPMPILDVDVLVFLAETYNCWYEVLSILEDQLLVLAGADEKLSSEGVAFREKILLAMRECYKKLGDSNVYMSLALKSCKVSETHHAASLDIYGKVDRALESYTNLVKTVESAKLTPTETEMNLWEERWVEINRQQCQLGAVSEYARSSGKSLLNLECAWKLQDWDRVRNLCSTSPLVASVEAGDPAVKMSETLLAVFDGKLSDVENLHAQTAQLCLYKWQQLPSLSSASNAHGSLLHYFHRLVEIRESGQIMVETSNHSTGKTLPDLKNLLNAWKHRLPNDYEDLTVWDELFTWRSHMFDAITSNFNWSEPGTLATLHDRPWTAIRMATTARKQGMRQTALLLLDKLTGNRAMGVSDAYLKLREQILSYNNIESEIERNAGLNLVNTTNLSYFDQSQKGELFRLKAIFLASLGRTLKASQAYCHSVKICPSLSKSWISWGGLCSTLGTMAERQAQQIGKKAGPDKAKESRAETAKKVAQYLAQAMGCYIEAIQISVDEKSRMHLPKCLWMLTRDGASPGVLCQTLENRGTKLPAWVWLPWIPQLLTGLCRIEGRSIKAVMSRVVKAYPQAVYYSLRAFYLERRDVERAKGTSSTGQQMSSVAHAEDLMSTLRKSHASLWSSLESILEELIVKFRPSYEEELLATICALLDRAESLAEKQCVEDKVRIEDEEAMFASWYKTLSRIAAKFFRSSESIPSSNRRDQRMKKTAEFKQKYKADFEKDFRIQAGKTDPKPAEEQKFSLEEYITKLQHWKHKLEAHVACTPVSLPLIESSPALAMFSGDVPDLWPGACDTKYSNAGMERAMNEDGASARNYSSTSSSAVKARRAAYTAAVAAAAAAAKEGVGGEYGGGSACIEIPGQYCPNSTASSDSKPSPELHAKLVRFEPNVDVLRRNDHLVRRVSMVGSDGQTYKFLLQFAIPYWTRTDERTAQTLYVVDKFLRRNIMSARNHLSVQPNAAIPVAQRLRMTLDSDSRIALDDVFREHLEKEGKKASDVTASFLREVAEGFKRRAKPGISPEEKKKLQNVVRHEAYLHTCNSQVGRDVLTRHIRSSFDGPEPFFQFRRAFAGQVAANSLLQYIFAVAERSPQRFVMLKRNGQLLSPDFRVTYTSQGFVDNPEVPFRLTPNVKALLGDAYCDGRFIPAIAMIAAAIMENGGEFDSILRLLMRDDIVAWYSKSQARSDSKTQELERQLSERVAKNVSILQSRIVDCAPSRKAKKDDPTDKRVRDLCKAASDPEKLAMKGTGYHAWL